MINIIKRFFRNKKKGIGFYIGEDENSIIIGNYKEWKSAGKPVMP